MAIEKLSAKTPVSSSVYFAGNESAQDYRYSIADILAYTQSNLSFGQFTTQYSAPSATGFTVSITDSSANSNTGTITGATWKAE